MAGKLATTSDTNRTPDAVTQHVCLLRLLARPSTRASITEAEVRILTQMAHGLLDEIVDTAVRGPCERPVPAAVTDRPQKAGVGPAAGPAPAPAPPSERDRPVQVIREGKWLTTAQAAQRTDTPARTWQYRATELAKEGLAKTVPPADSRGRRRLRWLIHHKALQRYERQPAGTDHELIAPVGTPLATIKRAEKRLDLVNRWQRAGRGAEAARRIVAAARREGMRVSTSSLYEWRKRVAEDGPAALIDRRRPPTRRARKKKRARK